MSAPGRLRDLAQTFLRLGVIGFGGPAAHIALMRRELVVQRAWMNDTEFMEMVGVTNLIPGPNSTEMAMHIGSRRSGWRGLLVSGIAFIAPAVVMVGALAFVYERDGTKPLVFDLRYGVLPVVIAIVAHALYGLSRSTLAAPLPVALALVSGVLYLLGLNELVVLVAGGALMATARALRRSSASGQLGVAGGIGLAGAGIAQPDLVRIGLLFLRIGAVVYGSGYVLLAFLERELVHRHGWLSAEQLLDAVAVGQITPGPVFSTATFLGWQLHGPAGAAVATLGVFAPSFVFVSAISRVLPWMRRVPTLKAFVDGVTWCSLGLMGGVLIRLADAALFDVPTWSLGIAALIVLASTRINSAWVIGGGAVVGVLHAVLV